jgi:hypothetical protein
MRQTGQIFVAFVLYQQPQELHDGGYVQNYMPDAEGNGEEQHDEAALPYFPGLGKLGLVSIFGWFHWYL